MASIAKAYTYFEKLVVKVTLALICIYVIYDSYSYELKVIKT
jgi:hypothetical protein